MEILSSVLVKISGVFAFLSRTTIIIMTDKAGNLRKVLSANIKKHREQLGFTQEKLAETAGISAHMVNDIEGCRTWISDKTLVNLAAALKVETYRLFQPPALTDNDLAKTALTDLAADLHKLRKDYNTGVETAMKTRGLKG